MRTGTHILGRGLVLQLVWRNASLSAGPPVVVDGVRVCFEDGVHIELGIESIDVDVEAVLLVGVSWQVKEWHVVFPLAHWHAVLECGFGDGERHSRRRRQAGAKELAPGVCSDGALAAACNAAVGHILQVV
jgi:hypothetical protein